ncbi:hypothetical protein HPB48_026309 [Haemaphysalis longicornis]|uniref:Uncharacterized protein n=1 Tax=Haemaphysalis longicornis TaxID=44386 RepID=A0A9J6HAH0_HAELO|nr:hypothetical protein HPB48_026309 [Haemaphysalis longicornis]
MKGQHPTSREAATLQGERAPARNVDVRPSRKYPVAAGGGRFQRYASSAEDDLQEPSTDSICSATQSSAGQLAGTSPRTLDLYDQLFRYVLIPLELDLCGYPLACPEKPGRVLCMQGDEKAYSSRKMGSRGHASFVITHRSKCSAKRACIFTLYGCSVIGSRCCGVSAGQPGCNSSYYHVYSIGDRDKLPHSMAREVFTLGCKMSFTMHGFAVARVSVVDCNGTTVYDLYVRTRSPVLD